MVDCACCNLEYNLNDRKPKILDCHHTVCSYYYEKQKQCYHCNTKYTKNVVDLEDDSRIIKKINKSELWCIAHEKTAFAYNRLIKRPSCELCAKNPNEVCDSMKEYKKLILMDLLNLYLEKKRNLTPITKNIVKSAFSNQDSSRSVAILKLEPVVTKGINDDNKSNVKNKKKFCRETDRLTCSNCNESISYYNLPYRNICRCIICAKCISKNLDCICFKTLQTISPLFTKSYPKIYQKCLQDFTYYKFEKKCSGHLNNQCSNLAQFYEENNLNLYCEAHKKVKSESLTNIKKFDSHLIKCYEKNYGFHEQFNELTVSEKYKILAGKNIVKKTSLKVLKRFTKIYPITPKDPRSFETSEIPISLLIKSNAKVLIYGIILGGSVKYEKITVKIDWNFEESAQSSSFTFVGRESYFFLERPVLSSESTITVTYDPGLKLFSGKTVLENNYTQYQITFSFSYLQDKFVQFGPILGFLYKLTF